MSLFISVERFGAEKRLFKLGGLFATIGLDTNGILVTESTNDIYYSVFCINNRYACQIEKNDFNYKGEIISKGDNFWIEDGESFSGHDYTFTFHITSTTSEVLATSKFTLEEIRNSLLNFDKFPSLKLKVANLEISYPIIPGVIFTVGSHTDNLIPINLEGIAPKHIKFLMDDKSIISIEKVMGNFEISGKQVDNNIEINSDKQIMLLPCGIILNLEFPKI